MCDRKRNLPAKESLVPLRRSVSTIGSSCEQSRIPVGKEPMKIFTYSKKGRNPVLRHRVAPEPEIEVSITEKRRNTSPTMKDMILAAFHGCEKLNLNGGVPFKQMVTYIRANFTLTSGVDSSLEPQVVRNLNAMILQGSVIQDTFDMAPMRGIYFLKHNDKLNKAETEVIQNGSTSTGSNVEETQVSNQVKKQIPLRKSISFQGRNATGDHSGVREHNVNPVNKARRHFLGKDLISKNQAKALEVNYQKNNIGAPIGVTYKPGFRRTLSLDSKNSMISSKVVHRQTNSKLTELRSNERSENSVTPPDDVDQLAENIKQLFSRAEEISSSDIPRARYRRNEEARRETRAKLSIFGDTEEILCGLSIDDKDVVPKISRPIPKPRTRLPQTIKVGGEKIGTESEPQKTVFPKKFGKK